MEEKGFDRSERLGLGQGAIKCAREHLHFVVAVLHHDLVCKLEAAPDRLPHAFPRLHAQQALDDKLLGLGTVLDTGHHGGEVHVVHVGGDRHWQRRARCKGDPWVVVLVRFAQR